MGKTSLIDELTGLHYFCVEESGRKFIKEEVSRQGKALPWEDPVSFAEAMFTMAVHDFSNYKAVTEPVFFDRGIPDVIGYLMLCGLPVPDKMVLAANAFRYHQKVFITPPWEEIYNNDSERKQSFAEAIATYEIMKTVYADLGYSLIELPKYPIAERADFVVQEIGQK